MNLQIYDYDIYIVDWEDKIEKNVTLLINWYFYKLERDNWIEDLIKYLNFCQKRHNL